MSYDSGLDDLMAETITVRKPGAVSAYGEPTSAGAPVTYKARVTFSPRKIIGPNGDEIVSSGHIWVSGSVPSNITVNDLLTLSDGSSPTILRADTIEDETGPHHQSLYI